MGHSCYEEWEKIVKFMIVWLVWMKPNVNKMTEKFIDLLQFESQWFIYSSIILKWYFIQLWFFITSKYYKTG